MTVVEVAPAVSLQNPAYKPTHSLSPIHLFIYWNAFMRSKGSATQRDQSTITCSTCGRRFSLAQTSAAPFCSERCKMIDLGRWLDEKIEVPHEGGPGEGERPGYDQEDVD